MSVSHDPPGERPAILGAADRALLLGIARRAIEAAVGLRDAHEAPVAAPASSALAAPGRAFVTLTRDGELRGCIGSLAADLSLADAVGAAAANAAVRDPRFPPVRRPDLPALRLDVSVLGEFVPLDDIDDFEPGVHGILVIAGGRRGLFLPEVATETGWDSTAMLAAVCAKAGLPRTAWRQPGAELLVFRTERFGGPVVAEQPVEPKRAGDPEQAGDAATAAGDPEQAGAPASAAGDGPPPAGSSAMRAG